MQSTAPDVSAYLEEVPVKRRAALERLRALCLETLDGYEESMSYGMPSYMKDGVGEVAWASQKQYISLYILKQGVVDAHRDALAGVNVGKGCIRWTRPDAIDWTIVESLLRATTTSTEAAC